MHTPWALRPLKSQSSQAFRLLGHFKSLGLPGTMQSKFQGKTLSSGLCIPVQWTTTKSSGSKQQPFYDISLYCQLEIWQFLGDSSAPPGVAWICSGYSATAGLIWRVQDGFSHIRVTLTEMALTGRLACPSPLHMISGTFCMVSPARQPDFSCSYSGLQKSKEEVAGSLKD